MRIQVLAACAIRLPNESWRVVDLPTVKKLFLAQNQLVVLHGDHMGRVYLPDLRLSLLRVGLLLSLVAQPVTQYVNQHLALETHDIFLLGP